jgi:hypothetical protein
LAAAAITLGDAKTQWKEAQMSTMTMEEQLAEVGRRIDELQTRARGAAATAKPRVQRHVNALRAQEAEAHRAVRSASDDAEDRLVQLKMRVDVADRAVSTDLSEFRAAFPKAVEEELHSWDAYFERLQTTAAAKAGKAREQAEAAIAQFRKYRLAVADELAKLHETSAAKWHDQKAHVDAARDQLEQKGDAIAAKLR